jgi:hypothetical protein
MKGNDEENFDGITQAIPYKNGVENEISKRLN